MRRDLARSQGEYGPALLLVHMAYKMAELHQSWYSILHAVADPFFLASGMKEAACTNIEYFAMIVKLGYVLLMPSFHGREVLKAKKNSRLWNPIFNYAGDKLEHRYCDIFIGCYSSMKELLMDNLRSEEDVAYRRARSARYDWCAGLGTAQGQGE